ILDANGLSGSSQFRIVFAIPATDAGHVYYRDDGVAGRVSQANITATAAADDSTIADIDPDWAHSWWSIRPNGPLPWITRLLVVDGFTQVGSSANSNGPGLRDNSVHRIELNGAGSPYGGPGSATGLRVQNTTATIRGLILNRWDEYGVDLENN